MKYVDASALLRLLFAEPGPTIQLAAGDRAMSSQIVEVESFRAIDRVRLTGQIDDATTATKRKELLDVLAMLDLAPIDAAVIDRAKGSFAVPLRSIDAIHVATAEVFAAASGGETVEFWTHDDRQGLAALSRGFDVRGLEPAR